MERRWLLGSDGLAKWPQLLDGGNDRLAWGLSLLKKRKLTWSSFSQERHRARIKPDFISWLAAHLG